MVFSRAVRTISLAGMIALAGAGISHAAFKGSAPDNPAMSQSGSPYLSSHSNDLVRWRAWGEEAFAYAKKHDLPLIVSFGYTACHWCHVMQEKHFNDPAMAKIINEKFVPVLVDRERRTALDDSYQLVTELLTQRSGWPNNVFMTPDLKPFYGTGYVEPAVFRDMLGAVMNSWQDQRGDVNAEADRLAGILEQYLTRNEKAVEITPEMMAAAANALASRFAPFAGGIGEGARFMRPPTVLFMLQQLERSGDDKVRDAIERTLTAANSGGIHDHIEGGFHRYTVDPGWRIPHFEKMLSDQALNAEIYLTAARLTGKREYADAAAKTLDYVLADLTAPEGGFYASRDADSEGEEGTYYVWTPEQLEQVLGKQDAQFAVDTFQVIGEGELAGKIVINLDAVRGQSVPKLAPVLEKLKQARAARPKPVRDEKILTNWNGMTIASLAMAGHQLNEPRYIAAAGKAADFIWANMRAKDGRLFRSRFSGTNAVAAEVDDYAQLARGMVFLFDVTGERKWLERALELSAQMQAGFEDAAAGDFFATRAAYGFSRAKPRSDVDQASGNGAALDVMVRLAHRAGTVERKARVEKAISAMSGVAAGNAGSSVSILAGIDQYQNGQTGPIQFAGEGMVRAEVTPLQGLKQFEIKLKVAEGWHINSNAPLQDFLIATELAAENTEMKVDYPAPLEKTLSFNDKPLALLEGEVTLKASFAKHMTKPVSVKLTVQTCSDKVCLLPQTLTFLLSKS